MICANRLAPAVLFSIGCAGLPAATHRCCDPCATATSEISPNQSPDRFWVDDAALGKSHPGGALLKPDEESRGIASARPPLIAPTPDGVALRETYRKQ